MRSIQVDIDQAIDVRNMYGRVHLHVSVRLNLNITLFRHHHRTCIHAGHMGFHCFMVRTSEAGYDDIY